MIFRMNSSRTFLAVITVLTLFTGCIRPESPKDLDPVAKTQSMGFEEAEKDATFYIDGEARGEFVKQITSTDGATKDVRGLTYRFTVCLSEKATTRKLQNFEFEINSPDGEDPVFSKVEKTDPTGCLIWSEDIMFDIGKPNPQPVLFLRKIKAIDGSSRQGEVSFIFQVFPWAKVLSSQEHPLFYYIRGDQRNLYRGQIQRLFSGNYNPRARLQYNEDEKTQLYVSKVGYKLTGVPFSVIKRDMQPSPADIAEQGVAALTPGSDYVLRPEAGNPELDRLLSNLENNNQSPLAPVEPQPAFDGLHTDLVLTINLAQPYAAVNGTLPRSQRSGRFQVLPYIYATDYNSRGDRVLLNPGMDSMIAEINEKGDLNLHYKGILPYAPTSGNIQLALQITPMDNNTAKYETVEELFDVGSYMDLIGKQSKVMEHPENFAGTFDFARHAKESVGYEEALNRSHLRVAEPYNFTLAGVRFKTIEAGETANKRTVIFNVNTCVGRLNFQSKILPGQEFEVIARHFKNPKAEAEDEAADNEERAPVFAATDYKDIKLFGEIDGDKIRTDAKGCLNFTDKISHKYYQTERLMRRKYYIKAKDDVQNFTKELTLYLNPWDEKFGTLGTDARSVSQTFLTELNEREKIVPRFYIQDFRYETLRFRYEVDKNMNLVVKKTVLFRAYPRVMRYSNVLQGINSIFPIRDGIYLMKVAYQKDYLDPAAKGIRLRSEAYDADPSSNRTGARPGALLERVEATDEVDEDGNEVVRTVRSDIDSAGAEAYAGATGTHLDGSQKVVPPYDPGRKTSISIVKKLIRVNSGAIVTPIEFSVKDLRLLRIRAQIFVQIEAVNQTRLQLVNMASREIEKAINLSKGAPTDIAKLPKAEQRAIIQQKMDALDTLAKAIPDDLEYTKDDASELLEVFNKPEVITAFSPFIPGGQLSSVARMLSEEPADGDFLKSVIESSFATEQNYIQKLQTETEELKFQSVTPVEERTYDVETQTTAAGQSVDVYRYETSEEFRALCGPSHKGYDQCVSENIARDADFDERACKCYDNLSRDYQDFSTDHGNTIAELNAGLSSLSEYKDFMSASSILNKVMASSQTFFSNLSNDDALTKLLLNDFTLAQAEADISDLDLLKDEVVEGVDIDKRTFVGPLTFLNNSNGGALRPTDNLDEAYCVTDDCNSLASDPLDKYSAIENFDYERSPYHGSIAHFAGKHVDDFINGSTVTVGSETKKIPSYKEFNENEAKTTGVKSLLSNFVEEYNLNYVSLKDKKIKEFVCENPTMVDFEENSNNCLVDYTKRHLNKQSVLDDLKKYSSNRLVTKQFSKLNKNGQFDVDVAFLENVVKKDHGGLQCTKKIVPASYAKFTETEYSKFCSLMTYGVFAKNYLKLTEDFIAKVKSGEINYTPENTFLSRYLSGNRSDVYTGSDFRPNVDPFVDAVYKSCLEYAAKGEFNEPLDIERKYRIEETGRYYYLGGKALNITLGQQVGISHKNDSNKLHKMDIGAITSFLPSFLKGYGYSYSRGEGVSANDGLNVQQGTFLVMQNAEFDVELKKYEQCLVLKWSKGFLKENKYDFFENPMVKAVRDRGLTLNDEPYEEHIYRKLREGMMICSGDIEEEPLAIRETYYYFTQHFTEGDMQDRADIHNHPWLLSLRGVREFETFLLSTLSDHDVSEATPEDSAVQAVELVGMGKLLASDLAAENLDGTGYEGFDKFKRNSWPLTQLIRTYRKVSPTFPGLYTQLNRQEFEVKQWPWEGSIPGEKFDSSNEGSNCYSEEQEATE